MWIGGCIHFRSLGIIIILFFANIYAQSSIEDRNSILFQSKLSFYEESQDSDSIETKFEPLPILSYDTNTGFGFGAKAFLLNFFKLKESLDVIIFASTKGEKWFRTLFSIPDFELRQGTMYPIAIDFLFDYDKFVAYNFFGVGNQSNVENNELYTRLVIESNIMLNRGFSDWLVGQLGLKYKKIESWNFEEDGQLIGLIPDYNIPYLELLTFYFNCRFDSRNSFIHPSKGVVVQADLDWTPDASWNTIDFYQWSFWFQYYTTLFFSNTVFAARVGTMNIIGDDLPIQLLIPIGSNRTLRGFPQDRFLDKSAALVNLEIRFPLMGRFGGLIGTDLGRVWHSFDQFSVQNWHSNGVLGLRYYMDTYVVRLDIGISKESVGIYFNFGHIF